MPRTIPSTTVSSSTVLKAPVKSLTSSTAAGLPSASPIIGVRKMTGWTLPTVTPTARIWEAHDVGHGRHRGLARRVAGQQRRVDVGDHRRDGDKVAAGRLDVRGRGLQRPPHAVEVDVDDAVPVGRNGPAHRLQRPQDAGARDDDVDGAEVLGDVGEDLLLSVEVADVNGPSAGVAVATQPSGLSLDAVDGQVEEGDVGAV